MVDEKNNAVGKINAISNPGCAYYLIRIILCLSELQFPLSQSGESSVLVC